MPPPQTAFTVPHIICPCGLQVGVAAAVHCAWQAALGMHCAALELTPLDADDLLTGQQVPLAARVATAAGVSAISYTRTSSMVPLKYASEPG